MVAIAALFLSSGMETLHLSFYQVMTPTEYDAEMAAGPETWNRLWLTASAGGTQAWRGWR